MQSTEDFQGNVTILYATVMMNNVVIHWSTPPRVNPNVNYGLWVTMC